MQSLEHMRPFAKADGGSGSVGPHGPLRPAAPAAASSSSRCCWSSRAMRCCRLRCCPLPSAAQLLRGALLLPLPLLLREICGAVAPLSLLPLSLNGCGTVTVAAMRPLRVPVGVSVPMCSRNARASAAARCSVWRRAMALSSMNRPRPRTSTGPCIATMRVQAALRNAHQGQCPCNI